MSHLGERGAGEKEGGRREKSGGRGRRKGEKGREREERESGGDEELVRKEMVRTTNDHRSFLATARVCVCVLGGRSFIPSSRLSLLVLISFFSFSNAPSLVV